MDKETVKQFVQALGGAQWDMNLLQFAAFLDIAPDGYARDKFQALARAVEALREFDMDNLTKLANYKKGEGDARG